MAFKTKPHRLADNQQRPCATRRSLGLLWVSLLALLALSCALPAAAVARLFATPTPSPTPTATHTTTPSPTVTPSPTATLTHTPTSTLTPTPTDTPTPTPITPTATRTNTPSATPLPPSLTPGPDEFTSGQDVWRLLLVDTPRTIQMQGSTYYPGKDGVYLANYLFLRLNFDCRTQTPLLNLYTGADQGLLYAHRVDGLPDLLIIDPSGNPHPVTLLGPCWLAAPLPRTSLLPGEYSLLFQNLPEFVFSLNKAP